MKYLVTGGTGFIGRGLVGQLLKDGHEVRILDNNSRGATEKLGELVNSCEIQIGDIRNYDTVKTASMGVDSVLHLAYINGTEFFYTRPYEILEVGLKGMLNVLDSARELGIGEVVLASTSEAYQTPPIIPTPEDVPLVVPDVLNPRYSYGGGKIACELLLLNYAKQFDLKAMVFRPHNVYGPDMGTEHVIPQLINKVRKANGFESGKVEIEIQGDGKQTRAFIHINDFSQAISKMLVNGQASNIYHIGNQEEVSISHVLDLIGIAAEVEINVRTSEAPAGGTNRRCPDNSKIRSLGYEQSISLADGIKETTKWYLSH